MRGKAFKYCEVWRHLAAMCHCISLLTVKKKENYPLTCIHHILNSLNCIHISLQSILALYTTLNIWTIITSGAATCKNINIMMKYLLSYDRLPVLHYEGR